MFQNIRNKMQARFAEMVKTGHLFETEVDRDKIWEVYLNAFPEEYRQENSCNCCKSFLRQFAGIVAIKGNERLTLWDFDAEDPEYNDAIKALQKYVLSLPIKGIYLNPFPNCGTEKNLDSKRNVVWNHYQLTLPNNFVVKEPGPKQSEALSGKDVFERSLKEITDDAVDTVSELIKQNSIYRGAEFGGLIESFKKVKADFKKLKNVKHKEAFYWLVSQTAGPAVSRIRNSAIGTLLNNLSEGMDLDKAVNAYERVVAPAAYKRPTSLVTPKMVENAQRRLEELNLVHALNRRVLSTKDLTVENALFVYRDKKKSKNIFDQLKEDTVVNPKTLSKVEEVTIQDFVDKILPTAKSIELLLENRHLSNLVTLVGPQEDNQDTLFKWHNNYSWSYVGAVADSIKERVKTAGGKVDGVIRASLSWQNHDDLDLHCFEPDGYHIYFGNKNRVSPNGGMLDVDQNYYNLVNNPVENICWTNYPKKEGDYRIVVNNYNRRTPAHTGFEVEIEYEGEVYNFTENNNGSTGKQHEIVTFHWSKKGGIVFKNGQVTSGNKYHTKSKWGLNTGTFHKVKAVTLSPNHWGSNVGNKHFFFLLDKCISEETPRGIYNEFLDEKFSQDRKVFEILGSKLVVEPADDELSGVGFSDTIRNDFYARVEGAFSRTIKVKI